MSKSMIRLKGHICNSVRDVASYFDYKEFIDYLFSEDLEYWFLEETKLLEEAHRRNISKPETELEHISEGVKKVRIEYQNHVETAKEEIEILKAVMSVFEPVYSDLASKLQTIIDGIIQGITKTIKITGTPFGATVCLNGKQMDMVTPLEILIHNGNYQIGIYKKGYKSKTESFEVTEDSEYHYELEHFPEFEDDSGNKHFFVNGFSFEMIRVDGGTYIMGDTSELCNANQNDLPTHQVTLSTFYIGKFEVTQAMWKAVMGSEPSSFEGNDLPAENVHWSDCQNFVAKLNSLTGKIFALPTEAQWEYAARGGKTHPVGQKLPNEIGLYDMSENVWEWCKDWYELYSSKSQTDPQGPACGYHHILRGGSWCNGNDGCSVSKRRVDDPYNRDNLLGFRLVLLPFHGG